MKIKICGITNAEDALNAVALGADAIGFIFADQSLRQVQPDRVRQIIRLLPPFVTTTGVFMNHDNDFINEVVADCGLDVIQLHGLESPDFCAQFRRRVIKAIRVNDPSDLVPIGTYSGVVSAVLLDTKVQDLPGGTGKTFDWGLAVAARAFQIPIILAGGISAENVAKAVQVAQPYGLDLSSSVESSPGKKDYEKMKALFRVVKSL